ncbi:unnamed protein product [Trifolium pratense]|uniref:Uncharacterized protein n=1 Tax=Trifolium pratense TaxID=57577 RepID=A0ACB0LL48_TRIPR|nr:unnamed protein product [Trifolium pratense]
MLNEPIMEVRDDFMLSPAGDSKPTFRTAHFLKPIANSIEESSFKCNPFSSVTHFDPNEWPLKIHFNGWRYSQTKWLKWVDQLQLRYETVWKKVGIFDAIMSTKCRIKKYHDLLYGIAEKWCSETNTFVFPFGEATITLEDVMVLGGYPVVGDPVFISLQDQEMRQVEEKLILARQQLTNKGGKATTSLWMDIFIDKGSEIEHEAFLATWLSAFVFPHRILVKSCLFPIAIHLARGNSIALAPAVLASIYRDLTLFKKTIADRYPLEVTLSSPFYLVQIWVWERFKTLQPQPSLIDHGDPLLFRWRRVKDFEIDNVRLALDSAKDDFHWRPYVRSSGMYGMFYPNDENLVPFKKDLDKQMLSFIICLRVLELVGFDSIEKYLPHRVAMQFGIDQDVPGCVPRFSETKEIAWKNYCRPMMDKDLYFPSRFFEADVTSRYSTWWKQSVLSQCCLGSSEYHGKILPLKRPISAANIEPTIESLEEVFEDAHGSKEARMSQGESKRFSMRKKVTAVQHELQFHSDMIAEAKGKETVEEKERKESDHEVVVLLKEQSLKNQQELARLAKQQEEMLRLMDLREKRDEELRQLLTSVLRNQQTPSSAS